MEKIVLNGVEDWMERELTADELNQLAGLRLDRLQELQYAAELAAEGKNC